MAADGLEIGPRGSRRWPRLILRTLACAFLLALLVVLIKGTFKGNPGGELVRKIASGAMPAAPRFSEAAVWTVAPTWPPQLRASLDRGQVSLAALRGHAVVLNFWASWCVPCKQEAPLLAATASRYRRDGVLFLGIDDQDLPGSADAFARRYGMDYVSVGDPGQRLYGRYGVTGFPETYFVDKRGRIVAHTVGQVRPVSLDAAIKRALAS